MSSYHSRNCQDRYTFIKGFLAFLTKQLVIASKWKDLKPPLLKNWYDQLADAFILVEHIDSLKQAENPVFNSSFVLVWFKIWQHHATNCRP